jgi:TetR/AcrR family transcriptional regulator, repressor for uid operon
MVVEVTKPGAEPKPPAMDQRQGKILDAAQHCFAQTGFHRTTMADIAAQAGMSAGNLYRYFASKDAVVAQLCARDRAEIAGGFSLIHEAPDPFLAFQALGRHHLVDEPRYRAVLVAEIWSEAARNPGIAKMCTDFDADIGARLSAFMVNLKSRNLMRDDVDHDRLAEMITVLVDGVISRRARDPDFDPAPFVDHIGELVMAAAAGALPSLLRAHATLPDMTL